MKWSSSFGVTNIQCSHCEPSLTTILFLIVDIGTDMVPAVAFAYEHPELDIMERKPRHSKRDHLVTLKLMVFAYMQTGIIQTFAGMFTYFYVLNDYGLKMSAVIFIIMEPGYYPKDEDVYDANEPNFGNSNYGIPDKRDTLYWDTSSAAYMDVRLFYVYRNAGKWAKCRWAPDDEDIPKFWRHSKVRD